VVVCRTGYTGELGFELLPRWDDAARCGTRSWRPGPTRGAALRARRAGHPAHRDGLPAARSGPVAGDHAGAGPVRLGGRLGQAAVLGSDALLAEKAQGPRRVLRGSSRWTAGSRAPHGRQPGRCPGR
jgi:aminomethyltransferase